MSCTFLYFAYGSNLLAKRIHLNNPTAVMKDIGYIKVRNIIEEKNKEVSLYLFYISKFIYVYCCNDDHEKSLADLIKKYQPFFNAGSTCKFYISVVCIHM